MNESKELKKRFATREKDAKKLNEGVVVMLLLATGPSLNS